MYVFYEAAGEAAKEEEEDQPAPFTPAPREATTPMQRKASM